MPANSAQHVERLRLIMNRIEGRNQVEGLGFGCFIELTEIGDDEFYISQLFSAASCHADKIASLDKSIPVKRSSDRAPRAVLMIRPRPQPTSSI